MVDTMYTLNKQESGINNEVWNLIKRKIKKLTAALLQICIHETEFPFYFPKQVTPDRLVNYTNKSYMLILLSWRAPTICE